MPLVQKSSYTLGEARDLVAEAFPNEDAWAAVLEALREPYPHQLLKARIFSDSDGSMWLIPGDSWRSSKDFQYDIETSRGRVRLRGYIEPVIITGEIRIDRDGLDRLLAAPVGVDDTDQPADTQADADNRSAQQDEVDPPAAEAPLPPSDQKTATKSKIAAIARLKGDYETVERLMGIHKCGPTKAAKLAHAPGGRSADAIERGWRRYRDHCNETAERQNGKNPDQ